jgi:hypothetical protein
MKTHTRERLLTLVCYLTENNTSLSAMECITDLVNGTFAGTKECYFILKKLEEHNIVGVQIAYLWELCNDSIPNIYLILNTLPQCTILDALQGKSYAMIELECSLDMIA